MARASEEALSALHNLVADSLSAQIKAATESGEPIPPALLAQAIKFLKDNGIDSPALKGSKVDTLKDELDEYEAMQSNVVHFRK